MSYEGQAAMELEFAIGPLRTDESYPFRLAEIRDRGPGGTPPAITVDWEPLLLALREDAREQIPLASISIKFHNTLVEALVEVARRVSEPRVVLTGGCFQNKYLLERAVRRLESEGFKPYWHQRIPPNDGGIALGQIVAAAGQSAVGSW